MKTTRSPSLPEMRFRIYKRKVVILIMVMLACGFAFWSGSRQKKGEVFSKELPRTSPVQATPANRRPSNESHLEPAVKAEADNMTLVYRATVFQLNFDQTIRNEDRFRKRPKDDLVVVVQVHNRLENLKLLIESLRRVRGIETVLLIFSHDYWSPEINQIIAAIDFCPVLQIFFPFSIQLYPQEFPGNDPRDCPRDIPKIDALKLGCNNAEYPDSFGHYREAKFSQTKHHWWWKLNFVWEKVNVLKDHNGLVLLIEDDHFLSPDFYYLLKKMSSLKREQCPDCDILSLGGYGHVGYSSKANKVEVKAWKSTEHNMGMALSRQTYLRLMQCADTFCTYDDYNWDWSLQHLTVACLPSFWKVMVSEAPRIFHAGECGVHHNKACMPSGQKTMIDRVLQGSSNQLFPKSLLITKRLPAVGVSPQVKNGGWGDIRDHELCKSYHKLQ
ncbi:hypothetical protein ANANG_G00120680 [Anguilla anguilla]|uniref:Alpha-1,6-mannosyl-glycoprotein 2-beta-N-acetylglucosaminyltransferase n=1 Tax=Anguilla anguilla TaxID=7936 RepID=A0A9D3RXM3_ANGAN|nr:hypothetical protein ANANG_G00120680 [Anguilla anguilla]